MTKRTISVFAFLLLTAALAAPGPTPAQQTGRSGLLGLGVEVGVSGGVLASVADMGNVVGAGRLQGFRTEMKTGTGLGASLTVPLSDRFAVRGSGRLAPDPELLTRSVTCPLAGTTSRPDHCAARSQGSFWVGTVDAIYRTSTSPGLPRAFFRLGAGVKRYDFSDRPVMEGLSGDRLDSGDCTPGDRICEVHVQNFAGAHTDLTGVFGFGLSVTAGPVRLSGELADYVSVFTPGANASRDVQHEVFITLGVAPTL